VTGRVAITRAVAVVLAAVAVTLVGFAGLAVVLGEVWAVPVFGLGAYVAGGIAHDGWAAARKTGELER